MLVLDPFFWKERRVLITGHTGFKGTWLCLWLKSLGAKVYGFALRPTTNPALYTDVELDNVIESVTGDVRDYATVFDVFRTFSPEVVFHLAAQSIVHESYRSPVDTLAVNIMGTVNVLEAARCSLGIRVFINVTSDKCYENEDSELGYRETDKLGGRDPYSVSKSCADLIGTAYYRSFLDSNRVALASVRAGNVIGGGDWADHRLVPDMIRAFSCGKRAHIRNPNSTRPWQHVLEPLSGYLALAQKLYSEGRSYAGSWNFGPAHTDVQSVAWLADKIATAWGDDANWGIDDSQYPYEAKTLKLDSSKSASHLEWRARWKLEQAILRTVDIYRSGQQSVNVREKCLKQIKEYQDLISQ